MLFTRLFGSGEPVVTDGDGTVSEAGTGKEEEMSETSARKEDNLVESSGDRNALSDEVIYQF